MDSRAKKQEMCLGANSDMILNLPDNVIDRILIHLPIRDAVRTSVLSTKWKSKWTTITELVFHDDLVLPFPHNNKDKLINFINLVFLLHSGFIHKFELSTTCLPISSMIDAWIHFLSKKNIKEFVLKFLVSSGERYKLPSCFFSAQQICTLELYWCVLKPPPTFKGFGTLKSLNLRKITFDSGGFECLISNCPILESLTLDITNRLGHLIICSPNLKYLSLIGPFQDICFENMPLLSDVRIKLIGGITDQTVKEFLRIETRNVIKVLSSLPSLRKFLVNESFLKFLTLSKIPEKLPFTCYHLNTLTLQLNFEDVKEICVTLCLLNSSPNLRELGILSYPVSKPGHDIENFWNERTHIDWKMSRLQVVKITSNNGFEFKSGLEFIKLLLANSPMLEMLSIRPNHNIHERLELMAPGEKDMLLLLSFQLLRFKRASPKAVIESQVSFKEAGSFQILFEEGSFQIPFELRMGEMTVLNKYLPPDYVLSMDGRNYSFKQRRQHLQIKVRMMMLPMRHSLQHMW